jgi:hypothetical protein
MVNYVDINIFPEGETGMKLLKEDIEMNNNHIKLATLPQSLTKPDTGPYEEQSQCSLQSVLNMKQNLSKSMEFK